jgi:tetratricopeptide (TPR) repeat protein
MYDVARPLYERGVEVAEAKAADSESSVASSQLSEALAGLAGLYYAQGRYSDAEPLFRRVLEQTEKYESATSMAVIRAVSNLGTLYYYLGSYVQAKAYLERALPIAEVSDNHEMTFSIVQGLTTIYTTEGMYTEAEKLISRRDMSEHESDTAVLLNNLGMAMHQVGKHEEAEKAVRRSLEIQERVHGSEDPFAAQLRSNLARVLRALARREEAMSHVMRALRTWSGIAGPRMIMAGRAHWTLGLLLMDQGQTSKALEQIQVAIDIYGENGLDGEHEFVRAAEESRRELI